jgi:hypothetical protein
MRIPFEQNRTALRVPVSLHPRRILWRFKGQKGGPMPQTRGMKAFSLPRGTLHLRQATIALDRISGRRVIVMIPAQSVLTVLPGPLDEGMMTVLWCDRAVQLFAVDLAERAIQLRTQAVAA